MLKKDKRVEIELKFQVLDPVKLFKKIGGARPEILYIRDKVFGKGIGVPPKIRERTVYKQDGSLEISYEKTRNLKSKIKKVLEEKLTKIPRSFRCENSYDKIRYFFDRAEYDITVDFYSIGVYCEIEGRERIIKEVAKKLGFKLEKNLPHNIDTIYRKEAAKRGLNELYHWGFGKLFWDVDKELKLERVKKAVEAGLLGNEFQEGDQILSVKLADEFDDLKDQYVYRNGRTHARIIIDYSVKRNGKDSSVSVVNIKEALKYLKKRKQ